MFNDKGVFLNGVLLAVDESLAGFGPGGATATLEFQLSTHPEEDRTEGGGDVLEDFTASQSC